MKLLKKHFKGFCSECGEPLGFIELENKNIFCYKCDSYKIIDKSSSLQIYDNLLNKLRLEYRKLIIEGDAGRYLRSYLNVLENLFVSDEGEIIPKIPIERKLELLNMNPHLFITMNIAIKWILEDLNYKFSNNKQFLMDKASNIITKWYKSFQQKVYINNNLGDLIEDENMGKKFYYYQSLEYYRESLDDYHTFNEDELNVENFDEKIAELFEKRSKPKNVFEMVKYDFPLTYICSLYNFYPNKNDRMFSFGDILTGYDVPVILKKIIDVYDDKRALNEEALHKPGQHFFAITTIEQLRNNLNKLKIPWSFEIFYYIFISSQRNPMSFPLLIEYENKIYISPTRLKIALRLMNQKLIHNSLSNLLSKKFEKEFQDKVLSILRDQGFLVEDPVSKLELINLMDKKKNTFEFDILAFDKDENNIYIVECKSFHPHPFYQLNENRYERRKNLIRYICQSERRIKPWLIEKLKNEPINGFIEIKCFQNDISTQKRRAISIYLPEKYHNIKKNKIISLYISQLNESFPIISDVYQLYHMDIK